MNDLPFVRRGQPITAELWNRLVAAVRSVRLLPGDGARLRSTPAGTIVGFSASPASWSHPFLVSLTGESTADIQPGLVNAIEPTIGGIALSGTDRKPQPKLEFGKLKLDGDGRGYVAVEITCGKKWEILTMEMVQVAYFDSENGEDPPLGSGGPSAIGGIPGILGRRVRYPLAMLRKRRTGQVALFQIVFTNLTHRAQPTDATSDIARHFFWPA